MKRAISLSTAVAFFVVSTWGGVYPELSYANAGPETALGIEIPVAEGAEAQREKTGLAQSDVPQVPKLSAVLGKGGTCESMDRASLERKYIVRNRGDLQSELDNPASRIWVFSNLQRDLIQETHANPNSALKKCLDDLNLAAMGESHDYWSERGNKSNCQPGQKGGECGWVNRNLMYLAKIGGEFERDAVQPPAQPRQSAAQKASRKASDCVDCKTPKQEVAQTATLAGSIADVKAKFCCDVFKAKDSDITTPEQCAKLTDGTAYVTGVADCIKNAALGVLKGLKSQLSILTDVFSASFWSGMATLVREFNSSPAKALALFAKGLMHSIGLDPTYGDCLHPNLRSRYYCDVVGNVLAQVGMMAGGWSAIFRIMKAGYVATAAKIPAVAKLGAAISKTRIAAGAAVTGAKAAVKTKVKSAGAAVKETAKKAVGRGGSKTAEATATGVAAAKELKSFRFAQYLKNPFKKRQVATQTVAESATEATESAAKAVAESADDVAKAAPASSNAGVADDAVKALEREVAELEKAASFNKGPGIEKQLTEAKRELEAARLAPSSGLQASAVRTGNTPAAPASLADDASASFSKVAENSTSAGFANDAAKAATPKAPPMQMAAYKKLKKELAKDQKYFKKLLKQSKKRGLKPDARAEVFRKISDLSAQIAATETMIAEANIAKGIFTGLKRQRLMAIAAVNAEATRQVGVMKATGVLLRDDQWEQILYAEAEQAAQETPEQAAQAQQEAEAQVKGMSDEQVVDTVRQFMAKKAADSGSDEAKDQILKMSNKQVFQALRDMNEGYAKMSDAQLLAALRADMSGKE